MHLSLTAQIFGISLRFELGEDPLADRLDAIGDHLERSRARQDQTLERVDDPEHDRRCAVLRSKLLDLAEVRVAKALKDDPSMLVDLRGLAEVARCGMEGPW